MTLCPCCSGQNFSNCCEPYLNGSRLPSTPEALMRSRYSAYSMANTTYIANTMCRPAADGFDIEEARAWASSVTWIKLKVKKAYLKNEKGYVEFEAYYADAKRRYKIHELSEFWFIDNKWVYAHGVTL